MTHSRFGPHKEIDALFHGPNWIPRPEFLDDVRALVQSEAWTTEWQYSAARPILAARADLLLWLDLPFWRVTGGASAAKLSSLTITPAPDRG